MALSNKYVKQIEKVEFDSGFERKTAAVLVELQQQSRIKRRTINMKKTLKIASAAVAVASLLAVSVFAISVFLTPEQIATYFNQEEAVKAFESGKQTINKTVENNGFSFTLEAIAPGTELEYFGTDMIEAQRTYAVIAIKKIDGSEITFDDGITFIPLIEGYEPWKVNGILLGGASAHRTIKDNIMYSLWDFTDFEIFADKKIYLAGFEGIMPSSEIFVLNSDGSIEFEESYRGTKAMFELQLDSSKANPSKAKELIDKIGK